ncbi:Hypothetical_protein [Hexamita inflata]|uniref:Hypothetical_protein n=1 Tax=Hexamita inflata TaxID=28002 RepID=A0AA86VAM3_9EUKA|nr:Hypothetical protein HINF_LOCUS48917 [Hexamita inflata]CAI9961273.1 Hypothetical protein HINF_LOCUS48918 [Hexamita inflata]CAI9961274.1 Hypothetical protein HINF_LOCUS48919 [Hexamita inflata]
MEFHVPNQILVDFVQRQILCANSCLAVFEAIIYFVSEVPKCVARFVGLHLYTELQRSGERRKSSLDCHLTQNQRAAHIAKSQSEMKVHVSNQICADFVLSTAGCSRKTLAGFGEF